MFRVVLFGWLGQMDGRLSSLNPPYTSYFDLTQHTAFHFSLFIFHSNFPAKYSLKGSVLTGHLLWYADLKEL